MTEWLDLMLDEVKRKKRETEEAKAEIERREEKDADKPAAPGESPVQSK